MVINFFSAFFDNDENLVDDRLQIAKRYLTTWFIVDLIGIIPMNRIFSNRNYNELVRISRLLRLYRLMKLTRMVRMLKVVKERNALISYLNDILKLRAGVERLFYFALIFAILCHISSCLWYLISKFESIQLDSWICRNDLQDSSYYEIYLAGLYFTISSITTVGYGDIAAKTNTKKYYSIILMIVGVCAYSFAISSVTSVMSSLNSKQAQLKEKLAILNDIKKNINWYRNLHEIEEYDHNKEITDVNRFLQVVPLGLKMELSYIMHHEMVQKFPFFQNHTPQFVASIGPLLRPVEIMKGEYIYEEGDPIDEMYFLIKGEVGLVLRNYNDSDYVTIEEGQYFGEIDFLISNNETKGHRRCFAVKALENSELLILSRETKDIKYSRELNKLKKRLRNILKDFVKKENIVQLKLILIKNIIIKNSEKDSNKLKKKKNRKNKRNDFKINRRRNRIFSKSFDNFYAVNSSDFKEDKKTKKLIKRKTTINLLDRLKVGHSSKNATFADPVLQKEVHLQLQDVNHLCQKMLFSISNLKKEIKGNKNETHHHHHHHHHHSPQIKNKHLINNFSSAFSQSQSESNDNSSLSSSSGFCSSVLSKNSFILEKRKSRSASGFRKIIHKKQAKESSVSLNLHIIQKDH